VGAPRAKEALNDFDVIITTYGTLRSDIKLLMDMPLDYVVLMNRKPLRTASSRTKSACLLRKTSFVHERYAPSE
jgi:non-specific serine/threonine protein kinase